MAKAPAKKYGTAGNVFLFDDSGETLITDADLANSRRARRKTLDYTISKANENCEPLIRAAFSQGVTSGKAAQRASDKKKAAKAAANKPKPAAAKGNAKDSNSKGKGKNGSKASSSSNSAAKKPKKKPIPAKVKTAVATLATKARHTKEGEIPPGIMKSIESLATRMKDFRGTGRRC